MRNSYTTLAALLAFALPGAAVAGKLRWFDDLPVRDSLGQVRAPAVLFNHRAAITFGVDAFKSLSTGGMEERTTTGLYGERTVVSVYSEFSPSYGDVSASAVAPNIDPFTSTSTSGSNRFSGFGIKWQHHVDPLNTFSLAAGYSETPWQVKATPVDSFDKWASLSWRSNWSGRMQPGVTGSLFFGDEGVNDKAYPDLGRKYYGFSIGGELRVARNHVPYFSYQLKRNFYNPDDPTYLITPYEDYSQISAGWRWQVQPNWSFQAEARYGLNGGTVDPYSADRTGFFFGTRFDFR